jgi:hypothetical protein
MQDSIPSLVLDYGHTRNDNFSLEIQDDDLKGQTLIRSAMTSAPVLANGPVTPARNGLSARGQGGKL